MKKSIYTAIVVVLSSATFVWADIDSKRLLQSLLPLIISKKRVEKEISKPLVFESPVVIANKPTKITALMAQTKSVVTQIDAAPISVELKTEYPTRIIEQYPVIKEEQASSRNNIVVANTWISDHHMYGGLVIPGCDDAVDSEYGSNLPEILLCKSQDSRTTYKAKSSESDPHSRGYIWNYR